MTKDIYLNRLHAAAEEGEEQLQAVVAELNERVKQHDFEAVKALIEAGLGEPPELNQDELQRILNDE